MENNRRALGIIFLTIFIDLLGFGIVMPLLPRYAEHLQAGPVTIGALMACFSAMQFLFAPLWGRLSDRVGRRPVLLVGLAGSVGFYSLFAIASLRGSLFLLFVGRIGAGIAGATISTAQAFIADSTPPERRTGGMALIGAAFGIGFVFGPLLGALALVLDPAGSSGLSPMPGWFAAGLSALALVLAWFLLPESLRPDSRAEHRQWFNWHVFVRATALPGIPRLLAVFFLATFAFAVFESTIALVGAGQFALSDRENFYLFTYIGVVLTLAQGVLVRRLAHKIPDPAMARAGAAILLTGMLTLVGSIHWAALVGLLVGLLLIVTGFALLSTATQSMISQQSPADQQGGILGVNQSGSSMARILGPFLGNVWLGRSFALPYLIAAGLMALVWILLPKLQFARSPSPSAAGDPQ